MLNFLCEGTTNSNSWIMLVVIGGLFVVMMLFTIIPQRKKKKEAQEMMQSVRVGKKIKTIGGFVGEIVSMDEKQGTMELNVGTKEAPVIVVVDKGAIYTVLNPDVPVAAQQEVKADEEVVPTAVTADDAEEDAVIAEKNAEKKAKKDAKKKEKAEKKATQEAVAEDVQTENAQVATEEAPAVDAEVTKTEE